MCVCVCVFGSIRNGTTIKISLLKSAFEFEDETFLYCCYYRYLSQDVYICASFSMKSVKSARCNEPLYESSKGIKVFPCQYAHFPWAEHLVHDVGGCAYNAGKLAG